FVAGIVAVVHLAVAAMCLVSVMVLLIVATVVHAPVTAVATVVHLAVVFVTVVTFVVAVVGIFVAGIVAVVHLAVAAMVLVAVVFWNSRFLCPLPGVCPVMGGVEKENCGVAESRACNFG